MIDARAAACWATDSWGGSLRRGPKLLSKLAGFLEHSDPPEPVVSLLDKPPAGFRPEFPEVVSERDAEIGGGLGPVAVGASYGLGDNGVDRAQAQEVGRRHPHQLRRLGRLRGIAPEDGGAPLGGDHGIDGVLEHQLAVTEADAEGPAAAAFAGHGADDGRGETRHLLEVPRDG